MSNKRRTWILLLLPPFFFILGLALVIVRFVSQGMAEAEMSEGISDSVPFILLLSQLLMLALLLVYAKHHSVDLFSDTFSSPNRLKDIAIGVSLGALIALCYFKGGIQESIATLQERIGDYVPPNSTDTSLGKSPLLFFVANVLLAPFVEENIYRNIGFKDLRLKYSKSITVLLSALAFGMLHWMGGFWYILVTAILLGIPLGMIQLYRKGILLVFSAHLTLNSIEFVLSVN